MRIITSLLHANYKENLMTRFSANKQNRFLRPVYIYLWYHGNDTYVCLTIKKPNFVLLTWMMSFLATKRLKVLEKEVTETCIHHCRFEVCMISAKLLVFWPASPRKQVTKAWVIRKQCFVAPRWQMAVSCGEKTNLPWNSPNCHGDPQICGQKINFPILHSPANLFSP